MSERTEVAPETVQVARETLLGDVRDMSLQWIKTAVVWQAWNEQQQQDVIDSVTKGAETLLERVCSIIASDGKDVIAATIEKLSIKDGITITLKCPLNESNLINLGLHQGGEVRLVYKDDAPYSGTRGPVYPDPDQTPLPFEEPRSHEGLPRITPSCRRGNHSTCHSAKCVCDCHAAPQDQPEAPAE